MIGFEWKSDLPLSELKSRWGAAPSRYVNVDGMNVHYRDEGAGPPVILLHGTGASLHTWDVWAATLSRTHRVVRVDLPGFGLTGPDPRSDYTIDGYVRFVAHVAARLGLDRFVLAGNSLGGNIAWAFAVAHPGEVRALVLIDAVGYPRTAPRPLEFRLATLPVLGPLLAHLDPRIMVEKSLRNAYGDPSRVTPALIERYDELTLRPGNRAAFGARARVEYEDHTGDLRHLHLPVLVMWGAKDARVPVRDAHRFADDIPGARLIVYPELGHVPMEEDGERTVRDATAFIDSLEPTPR